MRLLRICLEDVRNRPKGQLFSNVPVVDMINCKAFTSNQCPWLWLKTQLETNWDNTFRIASQIAHVLGQGTRIYNAID